MADEVRADVGELVRLASAFDAAATGLADALRAAQPAMGVPAAAFGDSRGGRDLARSWAAVAEEAVAPVDRLRQAMETDYDRLLLVAAAYRRADEDEAARMSGWDAGPPARGGADGAGRQGPR
ncbi:hypothetical protein R8Z50_31685 [Longispora sp. K20-0274]|uniref:hypothetical protein n=1 Tax=Longispora sp. K20-0274 TaxID=3088255 RepID=UPI00399C03D4